MVVEKMCNFTSTLNFLFKINLSLQLNICIFLNIATSICSSYNIYLFCLPIKSLQTKINQWAIAINYYSPAGVSYLPVRNHDLGYLELPGKCQFHLCFFLSFFFFFFLVRRQLCFLALSHNINLPHF